MSHAEQNAADELERVIAERQAGRMQNPAVPSAPEPHAELAERIVDSTRAARMDPEFAALLENTLNRQHAQSRAAGSASFRRRWDAWLGAFALRLSRSGGLAVAVTLVIALASFAVFRLTQSAPASTVPFVVSVATIAPPPVQPTLSSTEPPPAPTAVAAQPSPTGSGIAVLQLTTPAPIPSRATPIVLTPTPKPTTAPATVSRVKIVMLDINGGGTGMKIGCGDSIVYVERDVAPTGAPLSAAIREQLSIHEQNYGQSGLYNALFSSNLALASASIVNEHATINLTGTLRTGGVCDIPRVEAQIEENALQFSTVKSVTVFINGVEIHQALSQK